MIEIRTLKNIPFNQIHQAFSKAFEDYVEPFSLSLEELKYMVERRGYRSELSFGAFDKDMLVGVTLNGVDNWNGKLTAYDTGTGIIKEYRKKGIASKMFKESLPILRENNVKQYLLEVIKTNTNAFELYKKAGFMVTREFDYYVFSKKDFLEKNKILSNNDDNYVIRTITTPNWALFETFWDFNPSWQNSVDSIKRKLDNFTFLGAFKDEEIIGYGIVEKHTGDIPQFAVSHNYRKKSLGVNILLELVQYSEKEQIKVINTEEGYKPFDCFFQKIAIEQGMGQYEMVLDL